jgi:hypothetical protein
LATVNIGNLTFTHRGDYDGSTAYAKNDVVYYSTNGNAYIAKQATTGNVPTNGTYWSQFAQGSGGIWNAGLSLGSAGQSVKVNAAGNALEFGTSASGGSVYVMYGTSTSISSSDTKLQYHGTHANYCGSTSDFYRTLYFTSVLPCSGLTAGTNYYAELAGSTHGTSNSTSFNNSIQDISTAGKHSLMLIHYKKNS